MSQPIVLVATVVGMTGCPHLGEATVDLDLFDGEQRPRRVEGIPVTQELLASLNSGDHLKIYIEKEESCKDHP